MAPLALLPPYASSAQLFRFDKHTTSLSSATNLPLVFYHPFDNNSTEPIDPTEIEKLLVQNAFSHRWRFPMYDFEHYHTVTHELLMPFRGNATVLIGGTHTLEVRAGDVLLIPAGVSHRALRRSADFCMIGAYPAGAQQWDTCTTTPEPDVVERIRALGLGGVRMDPCYGEHPRGPVVEAWGLRVGED